MKKTIIAATMVASVFAATQAQAYFFIGLVPTIIAVTAAQDIGNAPHEQRKNKAQLDLMLNIQNGMPEQAALAQSCWDYAGAACAAFYERLNVEAPMGEPDGKLVTKSIYSCKNYGRPWFSDGMSRKTCYKLGVTDAEMPELVSFDPMDGNWD